MMSKSEELDPEYVGFLAERTISLMSRMNIPQTPANYSIWFNYCQGSSPALKRVIDGLFERQDGFEASTSAALISTFGDLTPTSPLPTDITKRLDSLLQNTRGYLQSAIADNRNQIQAIGQVASGVEKEADPAALIEILVAELSQSVTRASKLERNFAQANQELSAIRECLDEAETQARTDSLTGLANRRAFEETFGEVLKGAAETGHPASILLVDVDHFKRFNDQFGHGVGDEVLRLISKVVRQRVRDQDLPARYGGEELIAILPDADLAACAAVAESIRRSICDCRITRRSTGQELMGVSVSIGVAQWRPGESMEELVERCDRALYKAKNAGRNRVEVDGEPELEPPQLRVAINP